MAPSIRPTLYHLCNGIMRFFRWSGSPSIDLFKDAEFAEFRVTLDAKIKGLHSQGMGTKSKQAEHLTEQEEELLWERQLLGES